MAINISRENENRTMKIDSIEPLNNVNVNVRSSVDPFLFDKERVHGTIQNESDDDIGINYITNKSKFVDPDQELNDEHGSLKDDYNSEYAEGIEDDEDALNPFDQNPNSYNNIKISYEEEQQRKITGLTILDRLLKRGHNVRRLTTAHSLEEIESEVSRVKKSIQVDNGIASMRAVLMGCVNIIEWGNNYAKPFGDDVDLNGWSYSVNNSIYTYDDVFEELYEKYSKYVEVSPEIRLIAMVVGSGVAFAMQKKMMNMATNSPELMQNMFNSMNKFSNLGKGKEQTQQQPARPMRGPANTTDDILAQLDTMSVSSNESYATSRSGASAGPGINVIKQLQEIKEVKVPKKRGRKPKNATS